MKNKYIMLYLIVLILLIKFNSIYALIYGSNNYSSGVYEGIYCGDGSCNNNETCSSCSTDCGECDTEEENNNFYWSFSTSTTQTSTKNTNNSSNIECIENSDCDEQQYCYNSTCYDAECFNDNECNIESEKCYNYHCIKLLKIEINNKSSQIIKENKIKYSLKGLNEIINITNTTEINVYFWIEKDEETIISGHNIIYNESFDENDFYLPTPNESGIYNVHIKVVYDTYEVTTNKTIEFLINKEEENLETTKITNNQNNDLNNLSKPILFTFIILIILLNYLIFYLERKKVIKLGIQNEKIIKKYKFTIFSNTLFIINLLIGYFFFKEKILFYLQILGNELQTNIWIKIITEGVINNYLLLIIGISSSIILIRLFLILIKKRKIMKEYKKKNNILKESIKLKKSYYNNIKKGLKNIKKGGLKENDEKEKNE